PLIAGRLPEPDRAHAGAIRPACARRRLPRPMIARPCRCGVKSPESGSEVPYNARMTDTWTIYTDGGSRGNPGPAAYAYVIKRPGEPDIEEMVYLGQTTNNIAEYTGMVKALEHAKELGGRTLIVNSDSELMVKQMNGQYRVKNE